MIVSLVGALVFSLKALFYRIIGGTSMNREGRPKDCEKIVLFSEGKAYWSTFKPVIDALINRKQPFSYYTMDIEDPGLTLDYENNYMVKRYIGNGNLAYAKIGRLSAGVVLSTTPNIGTEGFPIPRSPKIKNLSHVFHAVSDMCFYHKGSLDNYDSVMLVGEFEIPILRRLEKIRSLPPKELHPAGLPYIDVLASRMQSVSMDTDGKTVLIAPSWGTKGCLNLYGYGFISELAQAGYNIIVRPHPQSWKVEMDLIEKMKKVFAHHENIIWDANPDGTVSLAKSDIMISDTSSVRFDYALLYKRPVITLESPMPDPESFEVSDLGESVLERIITQAGSTLNKETIDQIVPTVREILQETGSKFDLDEFREKTIYNWGRSGEAIAEYLIDKAEVLLIAPEKDEKCSII
jgi:hypothetical protein